MRDGLARKVRALVMSSTQTPRIAFYACLSDCHLVEGKPLLRQPLLLKGAGTITFDENVSIGYYPSPYFFNTCAYLEARNPSAQIILGSGTHLNNNCVILAEHKCIRIGSNVLIGTGVVILDSNGHSLDPERRRKSPPAAAADVTIGDNCFIGSGVRIMKGVEIGENSVIGGGSIVVGDLPMNVVAAGNPARILREL